MVKLRRQRDSRVKAREKEVEESRKETEALIEAYQKEQQKRLDKGKYQKYRDRLLAYQREYKKKNPEKVLENARKWRENNKELSNQRAREGMRKLRERRKKELEK